MQYVEFHLYAPQLNLPDSQSGGAENKCHEFEMIVVPVFCWDNRKIGDRMLM